MDTNHDALSDIDRSPATPFGLPPRRVSGKLRRSLCYPASMLFFNGILVVLAVALVVAFWMTDDSEIRYGLPFRWMPAGEGQIVEIACSSTEIAPSGKPAASGLDIIWLEQTLPDGTTIRARHPDRPSSGRFQVGQTVPLLHYVNDPNCLAIDDPPDRIIVWVGFWFFLFLGSLFVAFHMSPLYIALHGHDVHLLETASVKRFRVERKHKQTTLLPLDNTLPPIKWTRVQSGFGLPNGKTVQVFYDEAKPSESFVVEATCSPLFFDEMADQIDCRSDWNFWLGMVSHVLFAMILTVFLLRIIAIY